MRSTSLIPIFLAIIALFIFQTDSLQTTVSGSSPITSSGAIVGIDIDTDGGLDDLTAGIGLSDCFSDGDVKVFDTSEGDWDCGIRISGAGGSFVVQLDDVTTLATTTVMDFDDSQFIITESPTEEANISIEDIYLLLAGDSSSGDYTLTGDVDVGGGVLQIPNSTSLPGTCDIGDQFMDTNATSGQRLYLCESANTWALQGDGSGGGSAIVLDLADDDSNESTDLSEIAITGDTNSIFTESAADKLLIAVGNDWPKADTADDLTCTDCIGATEISDVYVLIAGDVMAGDLDMSDGTTDSPRVLFRVQTGTLWNLYSEDTGDDLQLEVNTASTETVDLVNIGAGDLDLTLDGTLHLLALDCTGNANGGALTTDGSGVVSCSDDDGGGASGDAIQVEDGDDAGTFTSIDTTARFEDQGHINFTFADGGPGGPDTITATVRTDALGATEIQDIYVLIAGDVMAGNLDMSDGTTDSPRVLFRVQTGALWNLYAEDTGDDLQIEVNTASTETVDFVNAGAGVVDVTVDGTITGSTAVAGPNVTSGANPGHTHTSTSISGLDVSDDVNLTCGTNCTLTGDEISVDDAFVLNAGDTMTGDLLLDNQSELRLGEPDGAGSEFIIIVAPATLAANRTCTLEDDSTPFDPCVSGAGGGDVTEVGPGCATGACFTDGLATTGSAMLIWEGTGVDTNELTIAGPANPAVDQTFTFPDDNIADDDLIVGNGAGTFEYKALTDCNADANSKLQYDTTTNAFSCETTDVILETELDTKAELETQIGDVADFAEADGDVFTGVHDFGGATSLEIVNGTASTVNADGEIAHDTTADQLILGADADVIPTTFQKSFTIELPVDADNFLLGKWAAYGITITDIFCLVDPADSAESVVIDIQERNATADSPATVDATITCDNDGAEDDGALSNGLIDLNDWWSIDIGTVTGTVTQLSVTVVYKVTRE